MSSARECALVMLENATYIQRELPKIHLCDALRARAEQICSHLIGSKHDIISEVCELQEVLDAGPSESEIAKRVERIFRWLEEDTVQLQALVADLEAAHLADPALTPGYVLLVESAANIVQPFNRTRVAFNEFFGLEKSSPMR